MVRATAAAPTAAAPATFAAVAADDVCKTIAVIIALIPRSHQVRALMSEFFSVYMASDELVPPGVVGLLAWTFKVLEFYETAPPLVHWALFESGESSGRPTGAARSVYVIFRDLVQLWPNPQVIARCLNHCNGFGDLTDDEHRIIGWANRFATMIQHLPRWQ